MFEWLEQELIKVKTPRFHVVDGPADQRLREAIIQSGFVSSPSYKDFVLKFGNARLYRVARNDSHRIGVFAGPRQAKSNDGNGIRYIGFHEGATVYLKLDDSDQGSIFESDAGSEKRVANDFETWLRNSCFLARKAYRKKEWNQILRGPKPFTTEELAIIETRRHFAWKVLGIDDDRNHLIEVKNTGSRTLPVITLGVRSKDARLNGAVMLKTGKIGSGQSSVLKVDCYKAFVPAQEIEIFDLPDPHPEDREFYNELKTGNVK